MGAGWNRGRERAVPLGIELFVGEGGYTSIAVAVSLLVSVTLVFCVATVEWTLTRAADVQSVADATSLAGSNVVGAYCTIAQVADACVLSMGLAGMAVMGAGLVLAAVPGTGVASKRVLKAGSDILDARNRFARSAASGLRSLEGILPGLVVANSWSVARANGGGGPAYAGAAIPFPLESQSDFSSLEGAVSDDGLEQDAARLQDAAQRAQDAKERAQDALRRAWEADCVDMPRCMRSRASSLAGLSAAQNPYIPTPDAWDFGVAIERSRAYYAQRLRMEAPEAADIESVTDSLAREAFYEYALDEVCGAWYRERADGTVDLYVPHLERNAREARETWLYTDARWPCSEEEEGPTLHATLECPGAQGPAAGYDSVSSIEEGGTLLCPVCRFDVGDLGAVANISTTANNGYEHYWQIVVEEAQRYREATDEQAEAERETERVAEEGASTFQRVLDQLKVPRPRICPPGAWGCASVVARGAGHTAPSALTVAFLQGQKLPAGVAVAASALAPDASADGGNVLAHLFDGLADGRGSFGGSLLGSITGLWGRLLVSYGAAYEGVGDAVGDFLGGADGVFGSRAGSWLRRKIAQSMEVLGLQPADMRMKKPVLVATQQVLDRSGWHGTAGLRRLVALLPANGSAADVARALGVWAADGARERVMTIAEMVVPGSDSKVSLTVDLARLGEGAG